MPKVICCAKCGMELTAMLKADPTKSRVITVVEPHTCDVKTVMETIEIAEDKAELAGPSEVMFEETEEDKKEPWGSKPPGVKEAVEKAKEDLPKKSKLTALFDSFPFVKKLNKEAKEHEVPEVPGDKRDKKHLREELITSSAPQSILNRAQDEAGKIIPEHELEEPEE